MEYFNKLAEEVQLATEELRTIFSNVGAASSSGGSSTKTFEPSGDSGSYTHQFDLDDIAFDGMTEEEIQQMMAEELMQNNPLQGIAEGVTKDILSGQVRSDRRVESSRFQNEIKQCGNPSQNKRDSSVSNTISVCLSPRHRVFPGRHKFIRPLLSNVLVFLIVFAHPSRYSLGEKLTTKKIITITLIVIVTHSPSHRT